MPQAQIQSLAPKTETALPQVTNNSIQSIGEKQVFKSTSVFIEMEILLHA